MRFLCPCLQGSLASGPLVKATSTRDGRPLAEYHGTMLAITHHTGVTLAEIGFLLILLAGVWLVAAEIPAFGIKRARTIVAGLALAVGGALLIVATHWGHFA